MSGIRSIRRGATLVGSASSTSAPIYIDSDDDKLKMVPAGTGTTEVDVADVSSTQTFTNKTLTSPTLTTPALGAATATSIAATGAITSSGPTGGGIGYATGAGGAVTQITSRTTGVTLSKLTGTITTDTTSLAAEAAAAFVVTNTTVAIGDVVLVSQRSGAVGAMTTVEVVAVAAGSFTLSVMNGNAAGGTAETGAIIINFAVIKAVSA